MFVMRFMSYILTPPPDEPTDLLGEVANILRRRPFDSGLSGFYEDFLEKTEFDSSIYELGLNLEET